MGSMLAETLAISRSARKLNNSGDTLPNRHGLPPPMPKGATHLLHFGYNSCREALPWAAPVLCPRPQCEAAKMRGDETMRPVKIAMFLAGVAGLAALPLANTRAPETEPMALDFSDVTS